MPSKHKLYLQILMILDIFSSFDPYIYYSAFLSNTLFWFMSLLLIIMIIQYFFLQPSPSLNLFLSAKSIISQQTSRTLGSNIKGFISIIPLIFIIIIIINLLGLLPYVFRISRHLVITLSLGIPIWISLIISSFSYNTWTATAQLLPGGAPNWLNPFLVLVETLRTLVRPITLSFRLAANITAGHVVLGLAGSYLSSSIINSLFRISSLITIIVATGYIIFEIGICIIQSYIFCLLLTLYSDDHS